MALAIDYYYNKDGSLGLDINSFEKISKMCSKSARQIDQVLVKQIGIVIDSDAQTGLVSILSIQDLLTCINNSSFFNFKSSLKGLSLSEKIDYVADLKENGEPVVVDESVIRVYSLRDEGLGLEIGAVLFYCLDSDEYWNAKPEDVLPIVGLDYWSINYKSTGWLYKLISCLLIV